MPGPAIAGILGSVASGVLQGNAAKKAAGAQTKAANAQIEETRRQFDLVQSLLRPYVNAGTGALSAQLDLMGIGGGGGTAPGIQTNTIAGTQGTWQGGSGDHGQMGKYVGGTPGSTNYTVNGQSFNSLQDAQAYADANKTGGVSAADAQKNAIAGLANGEQFQALAKQGEYGMMANAAATGGLRGGDMHGALAQFRPQMLQSLIDRQLANLGGIAANGQEAAGMTGNAAQNAGQAVNQSLGNIGQSQAGQAINTAQGWANAGSGILQTLGGLAQPTTNGAGLFQKWAF